MTNNTNNVIIQKNKLHLGGITMFSEFQELQVNVFKLWLKYCLENDDKLLENDFPSTKNMFNDLISQYNVRRTLLSWQPFVNNKLT